MGDNNMLNYVKDVLQNMPVDWLNLTTHRLDIYNEKLAKTQFLQQFEALYISNNSESSALYGLPTAYDYIRLGHPLSCILEWVIAKCNHLQPDNVLSFSSKTIPILAILRKNRLDNRNTKIIYTEALPSSFDANILRSIYGYKFILQKVEKAEDASYFDGSTIFINSHCADAIDDRQPNIDFYINLCGNNEIANYDLGSILLVNGQQNENYIPAIQHVRRRETIAMTPANCLIALQSMVGQPYSENKKKNVASIKAAVLKLINEVTNTTTKALVASSGLSIQYAILMGLIHDAVEKHNEKAIKIIVPTNCYGGTNDQARRVAASIDNVEVVDLEVDGDNDMVQSIDKVLAAAAEEDAVPYIIAEIPTNPRVEVPDLIQLRDVLTKERHTPNGDIAIDPVFILDQTFCPNVHFLGDGEILSKIRTISFSSGSKFPSGGLCTAGYCIGNKITAGEMKKIEKHLILCDNEATDYQYEILEKQLPSMTQRINDAYKNTREFVCYINEVLPDAKINFVSEELAEQGFTPSVFSLDLTTKGNTAEEKEAYKRALNLKLINLMITEIPHESKICVSYGQLKGCYWTIPATSTQGTTKECDKDYIVRVSLSPDMDLELHKKVFLKFVESI